ncbi:MAG: hydantoinase/oxoprolinase family protein [Thermomicrobiales bacterium]
MALDYAMRYPILTVASGPANSIRGAAFLSGQQDAIVIDVGGTTTDIGILVNGFPRESSIEVEVGGVRTNFRMPDLLSIALGGGTRVEVDGETVQIGPESVGYRITEDALVFGGDVRLSDVAVALGRAEFGDPEKVEHLDTAFVNKVQTWIGMRAEETIDRMKTSAEPIPVVLVGGGSDRDAFRLFRSVRSSTGPSFEIANAIGAAIAQCSGEVERIFSLDSIPRGSAADRPGHGEGRGGESRSGPRNGRDHRRPGSAAGLSARQRDPHRVRAAGDLVLSPAAEGEAR